jgi:hypothetical protein
LLLEDLQDIVRGILIAIHCYAMTAFVATKEHAMDALSDDLSRLLLGDYFVRPLVFQHLSTFVMKFAGAKLVYTDHRAILFQTPFKLLYGSSRTFFDQTCGINS